MGMENKDYNANAFKYFGLLFGHLDEWVRPILQLRMSDQVTGKRLGGI